MKQKSQPPKRMGRANQSYRPRNGQKNVEIKEITGIREQQENPNEKFRPVNVYHRSMGTQSERNINPGVRQNWKEQGDRSERRDNRMKPKKSLR